MAAVANAAPQLTLAAGALTQVYVPRGAAYGRCSQQDLATRLLCEPGVVARDVEDGDLTSRVLACPPTECLRFGCPGHEFVVKGAQLSAWCNF